MKILVDTNVLVSALFYPNSNPATALYHVANNHDLVLCDQNISELRKVATDKFSDKTADIDSFLNELKFELIPAVESARNLISHPKDAPILKAAIDSNVDIIISGDNHFLSLSIEKPKTMRPADYLAFIAATDQ